MRQTYRQTFRKQEKNHVLRIGYGTLTKLFRNLYDAIYKAQFGIPITHIKSQFQECP